MFLKNIREQKKHDTERDRHKKWNLSPVLRTYRDRREKSPSLDGEEDRRRARLRVAEVL